MSQISVYNASLTDVQTVGRQLHHLKPRRPLDTKMRIFSVKRNF